MNLSRFPKILICSLAVICCFSGAAMAADEQIREDAAISVSDELRLPYAKAAVLIEANSGKILFAKNSDTPLPPASTTKILTVLLAMDMHADMAKERTITPQAAAVGDMSLNLRAGEMLTLEELIQGALVHSGNDACYAIGQIIAGDEPFFVKWMNMKAAVLGAYSVNAANTNGLPAAAHKMSAEDLARLSRYALGHQLFAETVSSKYIQIGQGTSYRRYQNTNKLLWQDKHIVGVKTGTTDAAGPCLVAAYQDGEALYISVVMDSPDRYGESYSLLNYAAKRYMLISFSCKDKTLVCLPDKGGWRRLKAKDDLRALVKEAEIGDLHWEWHLKQGEESLSLKDGSGRELAATELLQE